MSAQSKDLAEITAVLVDALHVPSLRLRISDSQGKNSISYVCTCSDGRELYVKKSPKEKLFRSAAVLTACSGCTFVPRIHCGGLLPCGDEHLLVMDRVGGAHVESVLELSDEQLRTWVEGYLAFSAKVQSLRNHATGPRSYWTASEMLAMIDRRFGKSRLACALLSNLRALRAKGGEIDARLNSVIHGDFAFNNFLFSPTALSAIIDFDTLTTGVPAEDLILSFVLRFRDTSIRGARYERMCERLRQVVALSGWPVEDWHAAIDLQRLRFAVLNLSERKVGLGLLLQTRREDHRLSRMHAVIAGGVKR